MHDLLCPCGDNFSRCPWKLIKEKLDSDIHCKQRLCLSHLRFDKVEALQLSYKHSAPDVLILEVVSTFVCFMCDIKSILLVISSRAQD